MNWIEIGLLGIGAFFVFHIPFKLFLEPLIINQEAIVVIYFLVAWLLCLLLCYLKEPSKAKGEE